MFEMPELSISYLSFDTRLFDFFPTWSFNIFDFLFSLLWCCTNFILYSFFRVIRNHWPFCYSRQRYLRSVRIIFNNGIGNFWNEFESSDTRNLKIMNNYFTI